MPCQSVPSLLEASILKTFEGKNAVECRTRTLKSVAAFGVAFHLENADMKVTRNGTRAG